jgi:hypothetical protein
MSTDPTTRKLAAQLTRVALDVDELTRQLAARDDLTSGNVSGALYLLANAVDELNTALYMQEQCVCMRIRAEYLEAARILAEPTPAAASQRRSIGGHQDTRVSPT